MRGKEEFGLFLKALEKAKKVLCGLLSFGRRLISFQNLVINFHFSGKAPLTYPLISKTY
jgi:hypothetical protein